MNIFDEIWESNEQNFFTIQFVKNSYKPTSNNDIYPLHVRNTFFLIACTSHMFF
jgi:hypothetical protein